MIEVENLTKRYGEFTAVDNISFSIGKGEICGFLGPNGAGKTTTMRMLTGYMPPTDGKVSVAGFDISTYPLDVKRRTGYLPESTPLYTDMRVGEYLDFSASAKGLSRAAGRKKVAEVMDAVKISDRSRSLIGSLSKGLRQRVGIAQALVNDPEVLILDEPTIGLDPRQIIDIRSLIKDLGGRRTVILSSHILPEVQMICSRVVIINNGKLVADDTPDNLFSRFREGGTFRVKIEGPPELVMNGLLHLPNVEHVVSEGQGSYTITPLDSMVARKELVKLVAGNDDWCLTELTEGALSLEEVYLKLVTNEHLEETAL